MSVLDELRDLNAERALLGACLLSDMAIADSREIVEPGDFSGERHQEIYAVICDQATRGRVDAVTVASALADQSALEYLHGLQNATPSISAARQHASTIADYRLRRDLVWATGEIVNLAHNELDAGEAADKSRALLQPLDMPMGRGAPDPDIDSFIASTDTAYDWLIPDFLERRDRMLVTAGEGGGKSVLLTQIAVQTSCGIHPWTHAEFKPRNVLLIDLENSPRMVNRRLSMLRKQAGPNYDPQRLRVHTRPDGINLLTRSDRRWLIDRVESNAAELLVIGPVYRMSAGVAARGDVGGEDHARQVTQALDEIRNRCNVTLVAETHAPHGQNGMGRDLRPFGSSVWLRWPEFGIGLRRHDPDSWERWDLEHWRGPRDQRTWPSHLMRAAGRWPWTPGGMPSGTFTTPTERTRT